MNFTIIQDGKYFPVFFLRFIFKNKVFQPNLALVLLTTTICPIAWLAGTESGLKT